MFTRKLFGLSMIMMVVALMMLVSVASAQDATPTTEPTVEVTVEPTSEATSEATVEATVEATAEATVEALATAEPTVAPATTLPATGGELSPWSSLLLMAIGGLVLLGALVSLIVARRPS